MAELQSMPQPFLNNKINKAFVNSTILLIFHIQHLVSETTKVFRRKSF